MAPPGTSFFLYAFKASLYAIFMYSFIKTPYLDCKIVTAMFKTISSADVPRDKSLTG